jgi:hypothetical protein
MTNLDALKALDFPRVAALFDYRLDERESSPHRLVLRRETDRGKLLVKREGDRWLYCSCREGDDRGTVLDFVMRRTGGGIRAAADWLEALPPLPSHTASVPPEPSSRPSDRPRLARIWRCCAAGTSNPWLTSRGIPADVQADFQGCYRTGKGGDCLFAYRDDQGLCGLEVRNTGVKRAVRGSTRGLWSSPNLDVAGTVLLVEAPLDALAHSALYRQAFGYVALGGSISASQLAWLATRLAPPGRRVIAGFDNDEAGEGYTRLVRNAAPFPVDRSRPVGVDWTEDLATVNHENEDFE